EWQARVMSLRKWRGEEWKDVSDESLLNSINIWLAPYLEDVYKRSDLGKLDLDAILNSTLEWDQQQKLNRLAPSRIEVPSGSMIKLQYSNEGSDPVMEVRLQELFGLLETPTVNEGKVRVLIHLLSPGYKPVQVTQDLRSFWENTYHEVKKELHRRYPKHSWPEDPWTAKAVRGAKKRG
ncbi:MAG TPA: ATP-dependent helicase C-terminal domain-containing protein, partial [Cyclobacteriaceae bacterium]|nr:ATP-dependent helicase C-terminal domain-containing protein [Cyclobacteriaceae bacterium]